MNISVFAQKTDEVSDAKDLINKGNEFNKTQKLEEAVNHYIEAVEILEKLQDSAQLATVYTNIGVVNARLKNFDKAIEYLEKAEKYLIDNEQLRLRTKYNIAAFYYDNKDYKTFLDKMKVAELFAVKLKNKQILSGVYSVYCNYYRDVTKDYLKSINYGLKSYELKKELKLNPDITLNNIGYSFLMDKNYSKAIEYLSKIENTKNKQLQLYVFNNLKNTYSGLEDNTKALLYAEKYIKLKDSLTKAQDQLKIANLVEKYETDKQQQQIVQLKTENELQESRLKNQKSWFLGLGIFAILSGVLLFLWNKNRKTQQNLEKATLNNKLLRNQLNPHFIFHSLNSIQSYIFQNKKEASANYLANYSKLMRSIFDTSDKDFITIKEDKIAIENYLALQKLNFDEKVSISLSINDAVLDYKIPPMFVQPFVENALLHGIEDIENGEVSVRYQEKEDDIVVLIKDNGKGFALTKSNNTLNKLSSSEVIKKRIESVQRTHNYAIQIHTDSNKNGTLVTLTFPKRL